MISAISYEMSTLRDWFSLGGGAGEEGMPGPLHGVKLRARKPDVRFELGGKLHFLIWDSRIPILFSHLTD